jgi:hypothetical protein
MKHRPRRRRSWWRPIPQTVRSSFQPAAKSEPRATPALPEPPIRSGRSCGSLSAPTHARRSRANDRGRRSSFSFAKAIDRRVRSQHGPHHNQLRCFGTSAIAGEVLERDSVQPPLRRQLGMSVPAFHSNPAEAGVAEVMADLDRHPLARRCGNSKMKQMLLCLSGSL